MEITRELFVIPKNDQFILYAPLEGSAMQVGGGVIKYLQQVQSGEDPEKLNRDLFTQLRNQRVLVDKQRELPPITNEPFAPTSVTLLPTYACNLRCVYCYSLGGERVGKVMDKEIARSAIDLIIENALEKKVNSVNLGFHGGGEPLLEGNMPFLDFAVNYFRYQASLAGLRGSVGAVTNGVHNQKMLDWIVQNIDHLSLSIDGPQDIQDSQRPKYQGGKLVGSYSDVMNTLKFLEQTRDRQGKSYNYGMRATITDASVSRMSEIVEFFNSISKNKSFHLEPLFECGRCRTSQARAPKPEDYLRFMREAEIKAKELGVSIYYSGATLDKIGEEFCGACGRNFFITPDGDVTTCLEVCRKEDKHAGLFYIGGFDSENKKFDFNTSTIKNLKQRKVSSMPHCENCFAKYNCSGDCLAKVVEQSGSLRDPSNNFRCGINQGLLLDRLSRELDANINKPLAQQINEPPTQTKSC